MKVILLNGSPRGKSCTYAALQEIEGVLNAEGIETEIFSVGNKPIRGCIGCQRCDTLDGRCVFDDEVNEFIALAKKADGFVFGSPVHYAAPSGAITSLLDRAFYAGGGAFLHKPGAAIITCRRGGSTAAFDQLNKYFTINSMPVVSSQYWNMVHGNTPEEIAQDLESLQTMRTLGQNMAWLLNCIDLGKKNGIPVPTLEERVTTNFIQEEN